MRAVALHNKMDDVKPSPTLQGAVSRTYLQAKFLIHRTCMLSSGQGWYGNQAPANFVAPVVL